MVCNTSSLAQTVKFSAPISSINKRAYHSECENKIFINPLLFEIYNDKVE